MITTLDLVTSELKNDVENIQVNLGDYGQQIFDCLRLMRISEKVFLEKSTVINIKKNYGKLPPDFYKERYLQDGTCCRRLEAATDISNCDTHYTFNTHSCSIESNYDGDLELFYYGIQVDDDGMPMVTEQHGIDIAVKAYIRFIHTKARYYAGEVGAERLQFAEIQWKEIAADVRGDAKMPTPQGYKRTVRIYKMRG